MRLSKRLCGAMGGSVCRRLATVWLALAALLWTAGCETVRQSMPEQRDFSQAESDRVGAALATQPTGRDLDREGLLLTRTIASISDYATRVYENGDGQFVIDEKHTMAGGKTVLEYLAAVERKHLQHGVVYFISQGRIANERDFLAIKAFCVQHNVDMYVADSQSVRNIWKQGRPVQWDNASAGEVAWVVQARP